MHTMIPPEGSGVPEEILEAEQWRIAGRKLRQLSPALYDYLFAMLVASLPDDSDENRRAIHESYFVT